MTKNINKNYFSNSSKAIIDATYAEQRKNVSSKCKKQCGKCNAKRANGCSALRRMKDSKYFFERLCARNESDESNSTDSQRKEVNDSVGEEAPSEDQEEPQHFLEKINATTVPFPENKTIVDLFEAQVNRGPQNQALYYQGEVLTYEELNMRANQLAHYLRKNGVKEESLVAVCMESSFETIVGVLGILKAGAAYVPVDAEYPQDRIDYILEHANVDLVLGNKSSACNLSRHKNILLDSQWPEIEQESDRRVENELKPQNLAYVIFTSGSTGKPKGVMIEHRSLVNYVYYGLNNYNEGIKEFHFPLFTSLSFDLTQTSIFLSLLSGGALHIEKPTNYILSMVSRILSNKQLNSIKLTPSHVALLKGMTNTSIRKVILGGEALEFNHLAILKQVNAEAEIFNEYGPTEATIGCTIQKVKHTDEVISIGRPIWNTKVYVLDKNQNLVSMGVPGELCIAGAGLARGYVNRPELTDEKFINLRLKNNKEIRVYRTGDLAKWQMDGKLKYMGRIDDQVKIRGHRIELDEVTATLMACQLVKQGVVLAKKDRFEKKRLIAYVVVKDYFNKKEIKNFLLSKIPKYMVPSQVIPVEKLPLTKNGKLNKTALLYSA